MGNDGIITQLNVTWNDGTYCAHEFPSVRRRKTLFLKIYLQSEESSFHKVNSVCVEYIVITFWEKKKSKNRTQMGSSFSVKINSRGKAQVCVCVCVSV